MTPEGKAMSDGNPPFWSSVFSWIKGDWWKNLFVITLLITVNFRPWILQHVTQCMTSGLTALLALHRPCAQ